MKKKRHTGKFKFKVVMDSFKTNCVSESARNFGVNANQVSIWRKQFIQNGHLAFERNPSTSDKKYEKKIEQLENLIGKKEVEINLVKKYLDFYAPIDGSL
jgi:transposase-like protein